MDELDEEMKMRVADVRFDRTFALGCNLLGVVILGIGIWVLIGR